MSNNYYDYTNPIAAGSTARSAQVNGDFSAVQAGFDAVQADVYQAFRTSGRTPSQNQMQISQSAAQCQYKLIGFDSTGQNAALYPITPNIRGTWATATGYTLGDLVNEGPEQSIYYCLKDHTSGTFATDYANGDWVKLIDNTAAYQAKFTPIIVTANYAPVAGDDLLVDVTSGPITITLPASPTFGDNPIGITHIGGNISTNNITILHNGNPIMGVVDDMVVNTANASLMLGWAGTGGAAPGYGWRLIRGT